MSQQHTIWHLNHFPPMDIENVTILKKVANARAALAELKGIAKTIPNETILIDTLVLQEAKDSSEIESIITTQDELYRAQLELEFVETLATKEVVNYKVALIKGFYLLKQHGLLTNNTILTIQAHLENNNAGFRTQAGTMLKNDRTGEIIYQPPQHYAEIQTHMQTLEHFINVDESSNLDPLIKMALIHHQFESIHPFYDGNGRTGRIINILYLVQKGLLDTPILYLSRYINQNKQQYYQFLQQVRDQGDWQSWLMFMLDAIETTAIYTLYLIQQIAQLMQHFKVTMRDKASKIYSQDLLNSLFKQPYTKVEYIMQAMSISRPTAQSYLDQLIQLGLLNKVKIGRSNYYINESLIQLLTQEHRLQ